ncbi:MAG: DUF2939 domain-containing protein [Hyphomicrobiaceae bacterium]|nr:DUF2939 domain-containing protein [Hyphomicrobiaceae bacterium]
MRRSVALVVMLILALGGFYVAWPAWSARQVRAAIEANDPAALERKIDFIKVRERAKPLLAAEMERRVEDLRGKTGAIGAAIAGQLKGNVGGKLVEAAVDTMFTPANVIDIVRKGSDLRRAMRSGTAPRPVVVEDVTGKPPARPETAPSGPRKLGLENIKRYAVTGPLSIAVDIARDPAAAEHDVTVEMAFTGSDWKVVGLLPRL